MFKNIICKLGNMRKEQDWVVYPVREDTADFRVLQCDRYICRFNIHTGEGFISDGKGHPAFYKLNPAMGAKPIVVPADIIKQAVEGTPEKGENIGGIIIG